MGLTDALKAVFIDTADSLTGGARRLFMARAVRRLGPGDQRRAERELGWCRVTIREGLHELKSGFTRVDAFAARGRKRVKDHLPHLLDDIRALVDGQSQADPRFRSNRLYTRLSAAEVRSHRTRFMARLVASAQQTGPRVRLASYPPYRGHRS